VFVLGHLSDLHVTRPSPPARGEVAAKRALGWLSWAAARRREHRAAVLEALIEDLRRTGVDHVAVTGDLTHLGLRAEIAQAVAWLERLGGPERVSLVPGNHDAYARGRYPEAWAPWAPYMRSHVPERDPFPWVRRCGPLALVGLSSAQPTPLLRATGSVGSQCDRLAGLLRGLGREGRFRVVLIHHPPHAGAVSRRRALVDAARLGQVLAGEGAELVLHGHVHRAGFGQLPGPAGPIPVVGVASASARGRKGAARRAGYHRLRLEPRADAPGGLRVTCEVRRLDPASGRFRVEEERVLGPG
jgi:3',5'-cyclic AMP phosphodiesterase CpdA